MGSGEEVPCDCNAWLTKIGYQPKKESALELGSCSVTVMNIYNETLHVYREMY
jgi:hypothetical protein